MEKWYKLDIQLYMPKYISVITILLACNLLLLAGCISSVNVTSNRNQIDDCEFIAQITGYGDRSDDKTESTIGNVFRATSARQDLKIKARRLDANFVLVTETSSSSIKGEAYDCQ